MHGRRIDATPETFDDLVLHTAEPGDYWMVDGNWWAICPCPGRLIANLAKHQVAEHEDGTITVSPSILVNGGVNRGAQWHGFLERGVWREI